MLFRSFLFHIFHSAAKKNIAALFYTLNFMHNALMSVALNIALQECNAKVREIAGSQHNPRILAYHLATALKATTDEVPWCAAFVNWCLREAGIEGTFSAEARSFLRWGLTIPLESIEAGDVVVFARGQSHRKRTRGIFP